MAYFGISLFILADDHRYVLKDKDNDGVLFVVVFTLLHKQDVKKEEEEAEAEAEAVKAGQPSESGVPGLGSDKHVEIGENTRHEGEKSFQPQADDLD